VLPGETAQLQYELARVLSIAATVKAAQFTALKGGDRPYLGAGPTSEMPFDRQRFRATGPVDSRWDDRPPIEETRRYRARAIQHYRERGWIRPSAAWLVFDLNGTGQIISGLQLLGARTFWVFWSDGYAALASLDDNGDGWLDGDELAGLALWCNGNGNAVSEPGEVRPIQDHEIIGLCCTAVRHSTGILFCPSGVVFADGRREATYDWILESP
jgi:hypothetical protein